MKEQLRNRIYEMETAPPKGVWNRIAAELDQSDIGAEYPARLQNLSVNPPAGIWNRIDAALHPEAVPAITHRTPVPWLRYAAAAVVIAALAWGGSIIFNNEKSSETVATTIEPVKQVPEPVTTEITASEPAIAEPTPAEEEARNDAALEASKKTYAKLNPARRNKITNAAGFHFALDAPDPITIENPDPATRYIVLMTPDGNFIRMAKKWSNLVCCVAGEDKDTECVDQLKKWKEKLAHTSQTASPGNFGDILDLVRSLQQD